VKLGNLVQDFFIFDYDEVPGLLIACGGRSHGGSQELFNGLIGDFLFGVFTDASAIKNGIHEMFLPIGFNDHEKSWT
jgi:hypothetical protein